MKKFIVFVIGVMMLCSCGVTSVVVPVAEPEVVVTVEPVVDSLKIYDEMSAKVKTDIDMLKATLRAKEYRKDSLFRAMVREESAKFAESTVVSYNKKIDSLELVISNLHVPIIIDKMELSEPNSASGCDYKFSWWNNSKKDVKYLYVNVAGFKNRVGDYVYCDIRGKKSWNLKSTGPYKYREYDSGVWDTVIYNWSAVSADVSSIKVVYMDNTSVTLNRKQVADAIEAGTMYNLTRVVRILKDTLSIDKFRKEAEGNVKSNPAYYNNPAVAEYNSLLAKIQSYDAQYTYLKRCYWNYFSKKYNK